MEGSHGMLYGKFPILLGLLLMILFISSIGSILVSFSIIVPRNYTVHQLLSVKMSHSFRVYSVISVALQRISILSFL